MDPLTNIDYPVIVDIIYNNEVFESDVEFLRLIENLIKSKNKNHIKAAFYLADQFTEKIMGRILKSQIRHDSEHIMIFPPKINMDKVENIEKYHLEKLKWLKKFQLIDSVVYEQIKFVHNYRNKSYHLEIENNSIIPALAAIGFNNCLKIFKLYYQISYVSTSYRCSNDNDRLLNSLNDMGHKEAAEKTYKTLLQSENTFKNLSAIFKKDFQLRLKIISKKRKKLGWLMKKTIMDESIKIYEFFELHTYNQFSKRVHELHHEIVKIKSRGGLDAKEMSLFSKKKKLRETARNRKIRRLLDNYKQKVTCHSLKLASKFTKLSPTKVGFGIFIKNYSDLDHQIRTIELTINQVEIESDIQIQNEIDRIRGK